MKSQPMRILLVEDNDDHAELLLRSLEENAVSNPVKRVADGAEALDYLFRRGAYTDPATSPRPHVILLDLRLPKVDGLDVLKEIRKDEVVSRTPIVILTTSAAEADRARSYDLKANAYVVKPVDFEKFIHLGRDLGFFWLAWNQPPPGLGEEPTGPGGQG